MRNFKLEILLRDYMINLLKTVASLHQNKTNGAKHLIIIGYIDLLKARTKFNVKPFQKQKIS